MSKRFCKTGAVELAHFLRIYAGISFWLSDFFGFKERIFLSTSPVLVSLNEKNYYLYSFYFFIGRILGWHWNLIIALSVGSEEGIFFWIVHSFSLMFRELAMLLK